MGASATELPGDEGSAEPNLGARASAALTPDDYSALWKMALLSADTGKPRAVQTDGGTLGASDFGGCEHKAVLTVRRAPPTDVPVKGKAILGTAAHETLLPQMKALMPSLLVEPSLTATLPSGTEVPCHPDLLDPDEPSVTDLKMVADLAYKRREGVTEQQQMQRHIYALAMIQAGLADPDLLIVRNIFVSMHDAMDTWVEQQPYDPTWIDRADEWAANVRYAVEHGEDGAKTAPVYFCRSFCPWVSECRPPLTDAAGELISPGLRERALIALEAQQQRKHFEDIEGEAKSELRGISGRAGRVQLVSTWINRGAGHWKLDVTEVQS